MNLTVKHPLYEKYTELDISPDTTFAQLSARLLGDGFIAPKRGGYHFIVDDQLCALDKPLRAYTGDAAQAQIRIHGLLTVLI